MIVGGDIPKKILLIIDPQNDFTPNSYAEINEAGNTGPSLSVPNADVDIKRLADFLNNTRMEFDEVHVSLDSHNLTHIAHLRFWDLTDAQLLTIKEKGGIVGFSLNPKPSATTDIDDELEKNIDSIRIQLYDLTPGGVTLPGCENIMPRGVITIDGKETPIDKKKLKKLAADYINKLTLLNAINPSKPLPNTWPAHCIIGSKGWEIYEPLANVLKSDKYKEKVFIHEKGTNDLVEMYSIFKAEVAYSDLYPRRVVSEYIEGVPPPSKNVNLPNSIRNYETKLNTEFIKRLRGENNVNTVYVCG
jgi:nicotinamidase-related amidase